MRHRKGRGFLDGINNLSFNQQGPAFGRGFAPPYGGALLGANGSGRRMIGGRIGRRRGRGILDYLKTGWNFLKGNKDVAKYAKEGASFLGKHAKDLIKAKADSLKRKINAENRTPKKNTHKKIETKPVVPIKVDKSVPSSITPEIKPTFKRTQSLTKGTLTKAQQAYYDALKKHKGGRIRRYLKKRTKRNGNGLKRHYKAQGIPPIPAGLRA